MTHLLEKVTLGPTHRMSVGVIQTHRGNSGEALGKFPAKVLLALRSLKTKACPRDSAEIHLWAENKQGLPQGPFPRRDKIIVLPGNQAWSALLCSFSLGRKTSCPSEAPSSFPVPG